jgi:hypothetical protein
LLSFASDPKSEQALIDEASLFQNQQTSFEAKRERYFFSSMINLPTDYA